MDLIEQAKNFKIEVKRTTKPRRFTSDTTLSKSITNARLAEIKENVTTKNSKTVLKQSETSEMLFRSRNKRNLTIQNSSFLTSSVVTKRSDSQLIKSVLNKVLSPVSIINKDINRNENFLRPALPKVKRPIVRPMEPRIYEVDEILARINKFDDIKRLKCMMKDTENDLSSRIDDLKRLTKTDLQELKEERARKCNRNRFKSHEAELSGKDIYNIMKRVKNQMKKYEF